jgi:hypothetical protein
MRHAIDPMQTFGMAKLIRSKFMKSKALVQLENWG